MLCVAQNSNEKILRSNLIGLSGLFVADLDRLHTCRYRHALTTRPIRPTPYAAFFMVGPALCILV